MSCNIDTLTNIGTDCADESVEKALLVDDNRNCFDAYVHDSEGLKHGGAETKQRRREENMFARRVPFQRIGIIERARDDMFSTRVA